MTPEWDALGWEYAPLKDKITMYVLHTSRF